MGLERSPAGQPKFVFPSQRLFNFSSHMFKILLTYALLCLIDDDHVFVSIYNQGCGTIHLSVKCTEDGQIKEISNTDETNPTNNQITETTVSVIEEILKNSKN